VFAPTEAGADRATAEAVLRGEKPIRDLLPPNLLARLLEITDPLARRASEGILVPVVTVCCRRYAVEDADRRLTLDCEVETDRGKSLPAAVLEFKAIDKEEPPPGRLARQPMRPIKLSKFLWATDV
jgi:hypothetical protein